MHLITSAAGAQREQVHSTSTYSTTAVLGPIVSGRHSKEKTEKASEEIGGPEAGETARKYTFWIECGGMNNLMRGMERIKKHNSRRPGNSW